MGTSTDGQIGYGVLFEEDYEFPWTDGEDDDERSWWIVESGWKGEAIYGEDGNYLPGIAGDGNGDPRVEEYDRSRDEWLAEHPIPFETINYCSASCPMIMLAVPGSIITANRGYPREIDPASLTVEPQAVDALLNFCKAHQLAYEGDPGWYLSSYWG